jgi:hypothetical protein
MPGEYTMTIEGHGLPRAGIVLEFSNLDELNRGRDYIEIMRSQGGTDLNPNLNAYTATVRKSSTGDEMVEHLGDLSVNRLAYDRDFGGFVMTMSSYVHLDISETSQADRNLLEGFEAWKGQPGTLSLK